MRKEYFRKQLGKEGRQTKETRKEEMITASVQRKVRTI